MMTKVIFTLSLTLLALSASAQEENKDIKIGEKLSLRSQVLDEERPYWVNLPPSYNDKRYTPKAFPVLYLLDGTANFHSAAGVVQFMSAGMNGNMQIPEMIIVAIPNTDDGDGKRAMIPGKNRTRDQTPTHATTGCDGKEVPYFDTSGGGNTFLQFIRDELFPEIDSTYRTLPHRIIIGHSSGGLLALHALLDAPGMFQSYIAIDPSLWWDNQVLAQRAERMIEDAQELRGSVYISLAVRLANARRLLATSFCRLGKVSSKS